MQCPAEEVSIHALNPQFYPKENGECAMQRFPNIAGSSPTRELRAGERCGGAYSARVC